MAKKRREPAKIDRICNLRPSRDTEKDWRFEHALESNAVAAPRAALPGSVDLRAAWWDIGDQESTWVMRWLGLH